METKTLSNRDERINLQFKLLAAIGAVIVVSGHCYHGGISLAYEWFPIYSFNVSLFVFISGYFYKPKYEKTVFRYIWKRFKRLVIPAYLWNLIYGVFILLLNNASYTIGAKVTPFNLFVMPFVDGEAFEYNLGSWFVYPLFLCCVFNVLFRKLVGTLKIRNEYVFLLIYLFVGMYGIHLSIEGHNIGIMRLLTRTMFFLPSYQLGVIYRARWEKKDRLNNTAYFALLFAVQIILLTFVQNPEYAPSKMSGFSNGLIIPYVTVVTGIAFWLRISRLLTPAINDWRLVLLISDNTYSIMIHQMFGFMCVKWLFCILYRSAGLFSDFNIHFLRENIWYYYIPKGLQQYGMLYLAGGIFIPIGIKKICDMLYSAAIAVKIHMIHRFESG